MRSLLADLTHAFRIYRRTPLASGLAILVLAVAMAFVTAFLSMYVDIGIKGHPGFEQSGELVTIGQTDGRQLNGLPVGVLGQMAEDIRSLDAVGGVWRLVSWLRIVPAPLRDAVYRVVAANRYRWFGRFDACKLPPPAARDRFLD